MSKTMTLVSLQTKLWWRALMRSPQQTIGMVVVSAFMVLGTSVFGLLGVAFYQENGNASYLIVLMAFGCLIYLLSSVVAPNSETQVDPITLAPLPLRAKDVLPGLILTKFVQTGSFICIINTVVMMVLGWFAFSSEGILQGLAWIGACLGQLLLTLALGEAISINMSRVGDSKFQERLNLLGGIATIAFFFLFITGINIASASETGLPNLDIVLPFLTWIPLGGFANAAAGGGLPTPPPVLSLLISVAALAISLWLWYSALQSLIRSPLRASGGTRSTTTKSHQEILLPGMPATRMGAMISQAIKYWFRDARQLLPLATFPMMGAMYLGLAYFTDNDVMSWFSIAILGISGGTLMSNIIGMDGPANWVHITSGVPGRAYVWSKWCAATAIMSAWSVVFAVILGIMYSFDDLWVIAVGLLFLVLFQNLAFGLFVGSFSASPTPPPSVSAFRQKNNGSFGSAMLMFLLTLISGACTIPGIIIYNVTNNPWLGLLTQLPLSIIIVGVVMTVAGRNLTKNWPTLFAKVKSWA